MVPSRGVTSLDRAIVVPGWMTPPDRLARTTVAPTARAAKVVERVTALGPSLAVRVTV